MGWNSNLPEKFADEALEIIDRARRRTLSTIPERRAAGKFMTKDEFYGSIAGYSYEAIRDINKRRNFSLDKFLYIVDFLKDKELNDFSDKVKKSFNNAYDGVEEDKELWNLAKQRK